MNFPFDRRGRHELTDAAKGVIAVAALWIGLAMVIAAYAYATPFALHVLLVIAGAWLAVAGFGYVFDLARPHAAARA